jgi:hypothetical protein
MMKKAILFGFALIGFLCQSCSHVYFDKPQPVDTKNLQAFPLEIQGVWIDLQDTALLVFDATHIRSYEIRGDSLKQDDIIYTLSDSVVLRSADKLFTVNFRSTEGWEMAILEPKGDLELIGYYFFLEKEALEQIPNLKIKKHVQSEDDEDFYVKAKLKSNQISTLIDPEKMELFSVQRLPDSMQWIYEKIENRNP